MASHQSKQLVAVFLPCLLLLLCNNVLPVYGSCLESLNTAFADEAFTGTCFRAQFEKDTNPKMKAKANDHKLISTRCVYAARAVFEAVTGEEALTQYFGTQWGTDVSGVAEFLDGKRSCWSFLHLCRPPRYGILVLQVRRTPDDSVGGMFSMATGPKFSTENLWHTFVLARFAADDDTAEPHCQMLQSFYYDLRLSDWVTGKQSNDFAKVQKCTDFKKLFMAKFSNLVCSHGKSAAATRQAYRDLFQTSKSTASEVQLANINGAVDETPGCGFQYTLKPFDLTEKQCIANISKYRAKHKSAPAATVVADPKVLAPAAHPSPDTKKGN